VSFDLYLTLGLGPRQIGGIFLPPPPVVPDILPSAAWTGTAGSGFATTPTDPSRTTAKPAVRLLTPPYQWFTDTLDVGVIAMANDGGTLRPNFGIESVKFMFEGNEVTVTEPGFHAIQTQRGVRRYFGWWVRLKKPAGKSGFAHLYIEATARDSSMQKRVIGPYVFAPQNVQYTHQVEVAPSQSEITGVRYQTLGAAVRYVNLENSTNPLIVITEPGFYEAGPLPPAMWLYDRSTVNGYLNITASVPGVVLGRSNYTTDADAIINNYRYKLHLFGPNLTLDFRRATSLHGATFENEKKWHWIDGINVTNSHPDGVLELFRGIYKPAPSCAFRGWSFVTEVNATGMVEIFRQCSLVRGCTVEYTTGDAFTDSLCCVGNTVDNLISAPFRQELPAFTVTYSGTAATATLSRLGDRGGTGTNGGIWVVNIGGTEYTFDTGQVNSSGHDRYFPGHASYPPTSYRGSSGIGGYWFSDVVNWLNTIPGVSATLLLDENVQFQKRCASGGSLPGLSSNGFSNANIKNTVVTVVSMFDVHPDIYQQVVSVMENTIFAFNFAKYAEAQLIFLGPGGSPPKGQKDVFVVANALVGDGGVKLSQLGPDTASHLVIAHNTLPNQAFLIAGTSPNILVSDSYTMFKNNVFKAMSIQANVAISNLTIDGLHLHAGSTAPPGSTNVTIGGNENTLFVNFATRDLRPAGQLAQVGRPPALPYDIQGAAYPNNAALGAYAKGV
jgi:hypothetical protein